MGIVHRNDSFTFACSVDGCGEAVTLDVDDDIQTLADARQAVVEKHGYAFLPLLGLLLCKRHWEEMDSKGVFSFPIDKVLWFRWVRMNKEMIEARLQGDPVRRMKKTKEFIAKLRDGANTDGPFDLRGDNVIRLAKGIEAGGAG